MIVHKNDFPLKAYYEASDAAVRAAAVIEYESDRDKPTCTASTSRNLL